MITEFADPFHALLNLQSRLGCALQSRFQME
jgi:hypothetical protein